MSRFFLDLIQEDLKKRIIIETFDDLDTVAVSNFRYLCTGVSNGIRLLINTNLSISSNGSLISNDFSKDLQNKSSTTKKLDKEFLISFKGSSFLINSHLLLGEEDEGAVFGHVIKGIPFLEEMLLKKSLITINHCGELVKKKKNLSSDGNHQDEITQEIKQDEITQEIKQDEIKQEEEIKEEIKEEADNSLRSLSEEEVLTDSSLEFPSVVIPDFNEPRSFLERGGQTLKSPRRRRDSRQERDSQGRVVKGRGDFKFDNGKRSRYIRKDPYNRYQER